MKFTLDYDKYAETARKMVSEGSVFLKNDGHALPFLPGTRVAVFGRMQNHYYKSGTGSGGLVNVWKETTVMEAIRNRSGFCYDRELADRYAAWDEANPTGTGIGWGNDRWSQPEMPVSEFPEGYLKEVSARNEAALVIIARSAGEDHDNSFEEGSFRLQAAEEELLSAVCGSFGRVAVLLNVGNIIDFSFIEKYRPGAVLLAWQGGMLGAEGTVDMLTGESNPSGHLSDTVAKEIGDYPAAANFGDPDFNCYAEDIFVGYRYFETFARDRVLFPFGYGLSYTTFSMETVKAEFDGEFAYLMVNVTNTGDVPGKQVVQVYGGCPQGLLGKPARVLAAFTKTEELAPGETGTVILTVTKNELRSYDDSGVTGHESCFVLEAGEYTLYVGENVRAAEPVLRFTLPETEVLEDCHECMRPVRSFERLRAVSDGNGGISKTFEPVPLRSDLGLYNGDETYDEETAELLLREKSRCQLIAEGILTADNADIVSGKSVKKTVSGEYARQLLEVRQGEVSMEDFLNQISDEDLFCFVRGEGMGSPKVTPGTTSAFGGLNDRLKALGIPCGCTSDGPSGLRNDCGVKAMSLPNGTLNACTFNRDLVEELYSYTAIELRKNKIDTLLGPGMNIHRHPFNGRNFEYYSEDPYLTGQMAVSELMGMASAGVTCTVKHFCGNNQEWHRYTVDSVVSERALREIYLRGFEIAVREGGAFLVMTTYGRVNGLWTANDYELCTTILRDEWGFDGMVMTDWWASISNTTRMESAGADGNKTSFARLVASGNDTYMCCPDGSKNIHGDDLKEALDCGLLTREMLLTAASHVLSALMRLPALDRLCGEETEVTVLGGMEEWDTGSAEPVEYFTIGEGTVTIPLDIETKRNEDFVFGLELGKMGGYLLEVLAETKSGGLVQLPVTLYAWGIPVACMTWTGEDTGETAKETRLYYNSAFSVERLHFGQSGLHITGMRFTFLEEVESAAANSVYAHG